MQVHDEIASTSDHVRELGLNGHGHGLVVFAESQTAGRGRRENRWSAAPRENLLFSVLLRPQVGMEKYSRLATLAAVGLARAVESAGVSDVQIKWPNDLLIRGKKFCGILAEMFSARSGPFLVLGIGMNVNTVSFPDELREIATSLRLESGARAFDRTTLAIAVLRQLDLVLRSWEAGFPDIVMEAKRRSSLLGKRVRATTGAGFISGTVQDLGPEGCLLLRSDDGALLEITSAERVRLA